MSILKQPKMVFTENRCYVVYDRNNYDNVDYVFNLTKLTKDPENLRYTDTFKLNRIKHNVESIIITKSIEGYKPKYLNNIFKGFDHARQISGLNHLNLKKVISANSMFEGCTELYNLGKQHYLNFNACVSSKNFFKGCKCLTEDQIDTFKFPNFSNLEANEKIQKEQVEEGENKLEDIPDSDFVFDEDGVEIGNIDLRTEKTGKHQIPVRRVKGDTKPNKQKAIDRALESEKNRNKQQMLQQKEYEKKQDSYKNR